MAGIWRATGIKNECPLYGKFSKLLDGRAAAESRGPGIVDDVGDFAEVGYRARW